MSQILPLFFVLALLAFSYYLREKRVTRLQKIVVEHGWIWRDDMIPQDTPYCELLGFQPNMGGTINGFSGTQHGIPFVCADYEVGWGRSKRFVTLIAVCSDELPPVALISGFAVQRIPGWYGITKFHVFRAGQMSARGIERAILAIA